MAKPMYIDFQVAMPTEESAKKLAEIASKLGYRASVRDSAECRLPWTCECSTRTLATYKGMIAIQKELGELVSPLGGFPYGWGTFGNGPNGQPDVK